MPKVEAIVLAGGSATRLGRPKSLLALDGKPLIACILAKLREAGIAQGVVVVGAHGKAVLSEVCVSPYSARLNPHPEAGRTGSVQVGLEGVHADADVLLWPVDRPFAKVETVRAMLAANEDVPPDVGWLLPAFEAGRGHPILLKSRALDAIRGAPLDASLRDVLALSGWSRQEVPVPDAGIHVNVDTESDWAKALAWWRRETGEC